MAENSVGGRGGELVKKSEQRNRVFKVGGFFSSEICVLNYDAYADIMTTMTTKKREQVVKKSRGCVAAWTLSDCDEN